MMVDGPSNTCPSNVYGNSLAHTSMLTVVVNNGSSVTLIVLIVSQIGSDSTRSMMVDGPSNRCPSKVYRNSLAHTSILSVVVNNRSAVTVNVLILSQPAVDPTVSVMVDGPSNTCPSNV